MIAATTPWLAGGAVAAALALAVAAALAGAGRRARRAPGPGSFGSGAALGVSLSASSLFAGLVLYYGWGIEHGGGGMDGVGWALVSLFTLLVAGSLAELASALPRAGGVYAWARELGGEAWAFWTGWLALAGQAALTAVFAYVAASFTWDVGAGHAQSHLFDGSISAPRALVFAGVLATAAAVNGRGARLLGLVARISGGYQVALALALAVLLYGFAPHGSAASLWDVSLDPENGPAPYIFGLGLLQAIWTQVGYAASAYFTGEARSPAVDVPRGIAGGAAVWAVVGYTLLLALTWSLGSPAAALGSPVAGDGFTAVFRANFSGAAASAVLAAAVAALWLGAIASLGATARLAAALGRDGLLPRPLAEPRVAGRALAAVALVLVWSPNLPVVLSLSVDGILLSYGLAILLHLRARRRGTAPPPGPWSLGPLALPAALAGLAWSAFLLVDLSAPFSVPQLRPGTYPGHLPVYLTGRFPYIDSDFVQPYTLGLLLAAIGLGFAVSRARRGRRPRRGSRARAARARR